MRRLFTTILPTIILLSVSTVVAQTPEVVIGDIDFPARNWGFQTLEFEVTNNSDWLRFITIESDVSFQESYAKPQRTEVTHIALSPRESLLCRPVLEIPGNYGKMRLNLRIYDVVDTLDDLSLGNLLFEQPFMLRFHAPEAATKYLQEKISPPPLVDNSLYFDNEFARMLLVMLKEGKTPEQIATLTHTDTAYVIHTIRKGIEWKVIREADGAFFPTIPVISVSEGERGRALAETTSDQLAALIAKNLPLLTKVTDSMIAAGSLTPGGSNFMEGGTVLFREYALVSGMLLWKNLGQRFIVPGKELDIFGRSTPCIPDIGDFMYVIQGGDYFSGTHYYNYTQSPNAQEAYFGDRLPAITCKPGYQQKYILREKNDWFYNDEFKAESFFFKAEIVDPGIAALATDSEPFLVSAIAEFNDVCTSLGYDQASTGLRYWYWNLVATRTLTKLVKDGTLHRHGNGQFRYFTSRTP